MSDEVLVRCPYCKKPFPTRLTEFPCPVCGRYHPPEAVLKTKAIMRCPEHGLYEIDINRSLNFRKFCSEVASKDNRSPTYYTPQEQLVKECLEELGYIEGVTFFHNARVRNGKRYYWLDFILPVEKIVIEVSPSVWHRMWNRNESDRVKYEFLESLGLRVIELTDETLRSKKRILGELRRCLG